MVDQATGRWWDDDEALLAALDRALKPTVEVPASFIQAAHSCFSWRSIDAELAALAYDSAVDTVQLATTRAESAALRALTYEAVSLTFELEVMPDGLAGQLIPARCGQLQMQLVSGGITDVQTDDNGYFRIRPVPKESFRLRCCVASDRIISTDLITL